MPCLKFFVLKHTAYTPNAEAPVLSSLKTWFPLKFSLPPKLHKPQHQAFASSTPKPYNTLSLSCWEREAAWAHWQRE